MNIATATNLRRAIENEERRERFASWYLTLPGIPAEEKKKLEKSLKYNLWKSLIRFVIIYMILSLLWFFGVGKYDPFQTVTGYKLMGKKTVTAVVQEDGTTLLVKDPNKGEHIRYTLAELSIDPTGYSYGDRIETYWEKGNDTDGTFHFITAMSQNQASKIETFYAVVMATGYFLIIIVGLGIFFIRRRIYTGWFQTFYYRLEKFYSVYGIGKIYNHSQDFDLVDTVIAYGDENKQDFAEKFSNIHLTEEEKKQKIRKQILCWLAALLVMAGIILMIAFHVNLKSEAEQRENDARTAKVLEELENAMDGTGDLPDDESEYYNYADMMERAKDSFPGEDVYYKLQTTEDYVTLIVTTEEKKNVYFDRYVPVEGEIGETGTLYKLEIAMTSDAIQPDDILHNYTGILSK